MLCHHSSRIRPSEAACSEPFLKVMHVCGHVRREDPKCQQNRAADIAFPTVSVCELPTAWVVSGQQLASCAGSQSGGSRLDGVHNASSAATVSWGQRINPVGLRQLSSGWSAIGKPVTGLLLLEWGAEASSGSRHVEGRVSGEPHYGRDCRPKCLSPGTLRYPVSHAVPVQPLNVP